MLGGSKNRGEGYLYGDEYVITWAIGHLVSLCEPGEVDPNTGRNGHMNDAADAAGATFR